MNTYIKIILTVVIGISFAIVFSTVLEKGQIKYHSYKYEKINELFLKNNFYDVIFIGSSRTYFTVDPVVIDSITGLNTYNAGMEGAYIPEIKTILDGYLQTHSAPRLLMLTLDGVSFNTEKKIYYPTQYFWAMKNSAINSSFRKNMDFRVEFIKNLPFLRQIYYDDYTKGLALKGIMGKTETVDGNFQGWKGYSTNGYGCVDSTKVYSTHEFPVQKSGVAILQSIIDTCKRRNINLIVTYAPEYHFKLQASMSNFSEFVRVVTEMTKTNKIPFFRDDSLAICKNTCLFSNYGHVNTYGAREYSKILGSRITDYLVKE